MSMGGDRYGCLSDGRLRQKRSIVWLSGVRRVGTTSLCKQLGNAVYLNCDLPSVQRQLADPEFFLAQRGHARIVVLDEIHRANDPSQPRCRVQPSITGAARASVRSIS
jgi:predicted AAA+ superfamily ATPase